MTKRARFFEIVSNIFDFQRNRTGRSILLFVFSTATFGWFITNSFSLVGLMLKLSIRRWSLIERPRETIIASSIDFGTSLVLFTVAFTMMWRNYHRNRLIAPLLSLESPPPYPGLIVMLSPYNPRDSSFKTVEDINLNLSSADAREELLKSNWATLAVAVQHHAPALRHCWIVCTAGQYGSSSQYPIAQKVVEKLARQAVQCHKVELDDQNDISRIVPKLGDIYREAAKGYDIEDTQIIADFTGGTAAMSGGMILATVDENRRIEYLRQDKRLIVDGRALRADEIARETILVTISTSPSLVSAPSAGAKT